MTSETQKSPHFLVVDDDPESRSTIHEYLLNLGYGHVTEAVDGTEAIQILNQDASISFIISDWDMPVMNGLTFLSRVKMHPARTSIPFLMVTSPGAQETEKVILAAENLVDGYLIKPFRSQTLKDKIDQLLKSSDQTQQKIALVVDDDLDAREMIVEYLRSLGFPEVIALPDGKAALDFVSIHYERVGLIVSDWDMPEMNGLDFLKACKLDAKIAAIPFLMITSQSSIERMKVVQAARAHVDEYLLKPFNSEQIRFRVEAVMAKANRRKEIQVWLNEATENFERGNFPKAKGLFQDVLTIDPTNEGALMGLGDITYRLRTPEAALPYFTRAIDASPHTPKPYLKLMGVYEQMGFLDKAIALLQTGVKQVGFNAELHFELGRLYNKKGMLEEALSELENAKQIRPEDLETDKMLGTIQERIRKRKTIQ